MHTKTVDPKNCKRLCQDCFVTRVVSGRILHVCGECALVISSLLSCPKEDPYPDPVWPVKKDKSQTEVAMKREIAKSNMLRAIKNDTPYKSRIQKLLRDYK